MHVDREAVVRRHTVRVNGIAPTSPLSVGNGEVCWTVDVTGLQTFPEQFSVTDPGGGAPGTLLGTQAQWAWHSTPRPDGVDLAATRRPYRTSRGEVPYVDAGALHGSDDSGLDTSHRWLRANPHRLDLGRVGLVTRPAGSGGGADGGGASWSAPSPSQLGRAEQTLDLWTGVVTSDVVLAGRRVRVTTACHPERDALAVRLEPVTDGTDGAGAGAGAADVGVRLAFPYGSESWSNAADWTQPDAHVTDLEPRPDGAVVHRRFDGADHDAYVVRLWTGAEVTRTGRHELVLAVDGPLDLVLEVAPREPDPSATPLTADGVLSASRAHWPAFWGRGAALDLAGSTDPRAAELERRVVLSQYLTAIQCAGSMPPQETGLTCNSWRGRFHLEMHWWHAAHFAAWGRPDLLERSMGWYRDVLPRAQETARLQGYDGARWPKQVAPEGEESPSHIGPFLLWQQPHVIHLAELLRRAAPEAERADVVAAWGELVDQTARFMADVVEERDVDGRRGYGLGPPLVPAQESYAHVREHATDPPFELAYWAWALRVAQEWRAHAGLATEPRWDEVSGAMVPPLVRDGQYAAIGVEPFTIREDHPSMVYGLGVVPETGVLDRDVVRATFDAVLADWDWASTWGWDYPALAMTATRLGDPEAAVDALLLDAPKNVYLPNGHNRQTDHLPLYLPGNGGLLVAVALMVAGWEGHDGDAPPGFGAGWHVRHEGFAPLP